MPAHHVVEAYLDAYLAAGGLVDPAETLFQSVDRITAYLSNGGTLEHAQQIAAHASPKTTKLYDRTADTISLDDIERILSSGLRLERVQDDRVV